MADVNLTVDPGGTGDYASLAAWYADRGSGYDPDLVSAGTDNLNVQCICTNGAADTGGTVNMGAGEFTVDSTHKITIYVPLAYQHRGYWPTSGNIYRMETSANASLIVRADYTTVRGLAVKYAGYPVQYSLWSNSNEVLWDRCLNYNVQFLDAYSEDWGFGASLAAGVTQYFRNCYHTTNRGGDFSWTYGLYTSGSAGTIYVHNCSFLVPHGLSCVLRSGVTNVFKNCLLHGGDYFNWNGPSFDIYADNLFHASSTHNAHFHGAVPRSGVNWRDYRRFGQTYPWNYVGLKANMDKLMENLGATALVKRGALGPEGIDLRNDPNLPVTEDIIGNSRGGRFFIGAHQARGGQSTGRRPRLKRGRHLAHRSK